jgi:hypothetical protein
MKERGLDKKVILLVLTKPEKREPDRFGREVFQSTVVIGSKRYVVRVFVDVARVPAVVVTAYRTSQIEKYLRPRP